MAYDDSPAHILVIDDDVELSAMLGEYLTVEGFKVSAAFNGRDGLSIALAGQYDAVILDIMLPQLGGIEVLRALRHESTVPVIMLTAKGDNIDRVVGLELGADDYVSKPYYPPELVARLRAVLRRSPAPGETAPLVLSFGALQVDAAARRAAIAEQPLHLTASEFNMLVALLRAGDRVASKEELSLKVLGRAREAYDRSVDVHVSNLRQKLLTAPAGGIEIETVRGLGYRMRSVS